MISDGRGEHNDTEQTRGQKATDPVLKVVVGQVITRAVHENAFMVSLGAFVAI